MDMGKGTGRQDRIIGMHFFNPVHMMRLLEVIKTIVSTDEVVNAAKDFGEKVGKTVIVTPGGGKGAIVDHPLNTGIIGDLGRFARALYYQTANERTIAGSKSNHAMLINC